MKLFYSPTSPYVRKVMVTAIEKGLEGRIEKMTTGASPIKREAALTSKNPLGNRNLRLRAVWAVENVCFLVTHQPSEVGLA